MKKKNQIGTCYHWNRCINMEICHIEGVSCCCFLNACIHYTYTCISLCCNSWLVEDLLSHYDYELTIDCIRVCVSVFGSSMWILAYYLCLCTVLHSQIHIENNISKCKLYILKEIRTRWLYRLYQFANLNDFQKYAHPKRSLTPTLAEQKNIFLRKT